MSARSEALKESLSQSRQINIRVIGRTSGRTISNPVWFILDGDKLYLLPVLGSDTQWYKNLLENPSLRIEAGKSEAELKAIPVTDAAEVSSVAEKFRQKYGPGDVSKYYSKFDVAVVAQIG